MTNAKRDDNQVPVMLGVSSIDLETPTPVYIDPYTGAMLAEVTPGEAATLDVGSTTTGAPGTNASVVNSGSTSAAIFDFTIPRGNTGATGATGETGPTGPAPAGQIFLSAAGMWPSTTNGCALNSITEYVTNDLDIYHLAFDKDSDEFAQATTIMPSDWNAGTVTAKFYWSTASGGAAQTVKWYIQGVSLGDNEALDASWGTAVGVADTWQADAKLHITSATGAITIAGATASELVQFRVYRDVSEDDLAGDALLHGVMITFTRS